MNESQYMSHLPVNQKSRGVSMIEVLVTLVILSIGLLGLAGLQLTGMRSVNSASQRTQAAVLIEDISERMRSNITAVDDNLFSAVDSAATIDCSAPPVPYCSEYFDDTSSAVIPAANCDSSQLASFDISSWYCGIPPSSGSAPVGGVQSILTDAAATITCVDTDPPSGADTDACTDGSPHTISLSWNELNPSQPGAATVAQNITVTIQPR